MDRESIVVNGESRPWQAECATVGALLEAHGLVPDRVVVELRGEVLRGAEMAERTIAPGDRVEIVQFVGGG